MPEPFYGGKPAKVCHSMLELVKPDRMRSAAGSLVTLAGAATVVDATSGTVQFAWGVGDTATVGAYQAEWACDFSGSVQTVPTNSYITVQVVDSLGA